MDTTAFALIQVDREWHDPMALAKALAAARKTPLQDQVLAAKRAWGIVAEGLAEDEARSLGDALKAAGIRCAVGPARALAELAPVEAVHTMDALPDAAPTLIAAAAVPVTTTVTTKQEKGPSGAQKAASTAIMMTTGLPIKIGGKKRKVETKKEEQDLVFLADLHYANPAKRVRVEATQFDFSCLGERMLYQGLGNLKLLVGDLVAAAPEAWQSHGTRVLLAGQPIRTMGYGSIEDLEREARWLLTLKKSGAG